MPFKSPLWIWKRSESYANSTFQSYKQHFAHFTTSGSLGVRFESAASFEKTLKNLVVVAAVKLEYEYECRSARVYFAISLLSDLIVAASACIHDKSFIFNNTMDIENGSKWNIQWNFSRIFNHKTRSCSLCGRVS